MEAEVKVEEAEVEAAAAAAAAAEAVIMMGVCACVGHWLCGSLRLFLVWVITSLSAILNKTPIYIHARLY